VQEAIMVVDERSRHQLYRRLEEVLGPEEATTLIEHLPPVGWADVATKHDLAALEERMDLRFARLDEHLNGRFDVIDERFKRIDERFDHFDERFNLFDERWNDRLMASTSDLRATFEHELRSQTMTIVFGMVGVVLTMAGLAFALVRFT